MNKNIEVEVRSFIDDIQFLEIKNKLDNDFDFLEELNEITVYFSGEKDLRVRKNEEGAFLILKEGVIHDDFRKEFEIKVDSGDFDDLLSLLLSLGYEIEIKWIRKRLEYKRGDIKILLDDTRGYGKILELEKMSVEGEEDAVKKILLDTIKELGISEITPREEFNKHFEYYKSNWKKLIT